VGKGSTGRTQGQKGAKRDIGGRMNVGMHTFARACSTSLRTKG